MLAVRRVRCELHARYVLRSLYKCYLRKSARISNAKTMCIFQRRICTAAKYARHNRGRLRANETRAMSARAQAVCRACRHPRSAVPPAQARGARPRHLGVDLPGAPSLILLPSPQSQVSTPSLPRRLGSVSRSTFYDPTSTLAGFDPTSRHG